MGCELNKKEKGNLNLKPTYLPEKHIKGHDIYMSKDELKKTICEIIIENNHGTGYGTGFISKIKYKNDYMICLLTNHHVISEDMIKSKEYIKIKINNSQKYLDLKLIRKIFYNEEMDYMCIEILQEDNIEYEIIDIDDNCYNNSYNNKEYNGKYIMVSGIGKKKYIYSSIGKMQYIKNKSWFAHNGSTERGFSGGPIVLTNQNKIIGKIIGIHRGSIDEYEQNAGIYMNEIIKDIYKKIIPEINIFYKIINNNKIRIFGEEFVINNKNNCKIIYENKAYKLSEYFTINNNSNELHIKLKGSINDISCIFADCDTLISLPDISNLNTTINMSYLFYNCKSLQILDPNISNWDISNVKYIHGMFHGCSSLRQLPEISKWDTKNIIYMGGRFLNRSSLSSIKSNENPIKNELHPGIFRGCLSLKQLPDISKWNTNNVENMSFLFWGCSSLKQLPDISKWNTNNVKTIFFMFCNCSSLEVLPDISKWNTYNIEDMSGLFFGCSSLKELPDISKWNTYNIENMGCLFFDCKSLKELPDISKWNTNKVHTMSCMFMGCSSLILLPDISKWDTNNVKDMNGIFDRCSSLKEIPAKFKNQNSLEEKVLQEFWSYINNEISSFNLRNEERLINNN